MGAWEVFILLIYIIHRHFYANIAILNRITNISLTFLSMK